MIKRGDRVYYKLRVGYNWFTIQSRILNNRGKYATIQQSTKGRLSRRMSMKLSNLTKCQTQY